jgi:aminoglycoside phosphotransferase family enzyme/predicted kinase
MSVENDTDQQDHGQQDQTDQHEVIAALASSELLTAGNGKPRQVETHCSHIFLTADRAFKLKKAVAFSYLDYRGLAARERFIRAELDLNRRTAPQLYLRCHKIARSETGSLMLSPPEDPAPALDWLLEMQRFPDDALLADYLRRGELTPALLRDLADVIHDFHCQAQRRPDQGGADEMGRVLQECLDNLRRQAPPLDRHVVADLARDLTAQLTRQSALLDQRRRDGFVRHCHGDLHLGNICVIAGKPVLFDCIDFSETLSCTDIAYDLAFLLMDLCHCGHATVGHANVGRVTAGEADVGQADVGQADGSPGDVDRVKIDQADVDRTGVAHANLLLNRWIDRSGDSAALAPMPFFQSLRAAVRAHILATSHRDAEALAYLASAVAHLQPGAPRLIAIGGLSGSGKSTLARRLAPDFRPLPGARIIRSDSLRKRLASVAPETRLPADSYTPEMSQRIYTAMLMEARQVLAAGYTVIIDAAFLRAGERDAVDALAAELQVPSHGLWLDVPAGVLKDRIAQRHDDASDADQAVLAWQLTLDLGPMTWQRIAAGADPATSLAALRQAVPADRAAD